MESEIEDLPTDLFRGLDFKIVKTSKGGFDDYSTSKWALRGLTKSAAMELASAGVRVNCICPGVVDTEMIRNNQKLFDALQHITPMGHMASADQLADAMFFLLGPQSAYITGVDLAVDGGLTSGGIFWPVGRAVGAL
jgi:3alpha(or 20beta)-hydroxysteroid dehydrogenase